MGEMPTVYSCDNRKARINHKCHECHGVILAGERYNYHHGIWDGEPGQYKVCLECDALREEFNKEIKDWEERVCFGEIYEFVFECHHKRDLSVIKRFLDNKRKRGAPIPDWMLRREQELTVTLG